MNSLSVVAAYGALCSVSLMAGTAIGRASHPGSGIKGYVQHVAAGFVFAAAAVEVLPRVMRGGRPVAASLGFAAGVAATLAIRLISKRFGGSASGGIAFVAVVITDNFIDGLLIGVAATSAAGRQLGLLVAVAVCAELLSLGLSLGAKFGDASRRRMITVAAATSAAPLLGALAGYFLGGILTEGWNEAVLAFAVAVFLYMAAEELLKDAHESGETAIGTALLFAAFLLMMILDMVIS
jgi:ZIP family zinc transporter